VIEVVLKSFPCLGLEVDLSMANAPVGTHTAEKEQDELSERLAKLRNMDS